jgi:hypothetical protein
VIVNDPETLDAVRKAFQRYEQALMANDLAVLDELFLDSPETLRFGATENLYGIAAIRAFRKARIGGSPRRTLAATIITAYGPDVATANTEFRYAGETRTGRQSQVWVRTARGWQIACAHVSFIEGGM